MKRITVFFLIILSSIAANAQMVVPEKYQNIFHDYKTGLEKFNAFLDETKAINTKPIIFGAELLAANSNRGENLLSPLTISAVIETLDRFKEMGITGVTVAIGYPILTDDINQSKEYINFYKQVAKLIHERNMTLCVKLHVLFSGTVNNSMKVNFSDMTIGKLKEAKKLMAKRAISDLNPDYLSLCGEPDTESKLTKIDKINNPKEYAEIIKYIIKGLKKGKTLIGAGQGAWGTADFAKEFAKLNIDFINVHVYPFGNKVFDVLNQICLAAKENKKRIIMDEFWLYKISSGEDPGADNRDNIYKKDHYSFWQPVDQLFISAMVKYAYLNNIEYVSPFWSSNFFAYLDYQSKYDEISYILETVKLNQAVSDNMHSDIFSETGKYYSELIKKYK